MDRRRFRVYHTYNDLDLHTKMAYCLSDMYHFCEITNQNFKSDTPKDFLVEKSEGLVELRRYGRKVIYCNLRINHTPLNLEISVYRKYKVSVS